MAISIEIFPLSSTLDMYGGPDASSAYSLSGHVSISLSSPATLFERRRAVRLLLQSLVITFEGQSELVSPSTGYSAVRLCSISQELAPNEPLELSNEDGLEESDAPCTYNVLFNLRIPGWLPASDTFGDCKQSPPGTRYSLHAIANFVPSDPESSSGSWLAALCSPFYSKTRVVHAPLCEITLNRFGALPSMAASDLSTYPSVNYSVAAHPEDADPASRDPNAIPLDVLSKIQTVVSIPEHIAVEKDSFDFSLRFRAPEQAQLEGRLQITDFSVEVEQTEKYRASGSKYTSRYPLPKDRHQPPNEPLRNPHPIQALFDLGLMSSAFTPSAATSRTFSLLPPDLVAAYRLTGDGLTFASDSAVDPTSWYTMTTSVPFVSAGTPRAEDETEKAEGRSWAGAHNIRPTSQSPFFGVKHTLRVAVSCAYEPSAGAEPILEKLIFSLPLDFVRTRPAPVPVGQQHQRSESGASTTSSQYSVPELPAYSQLFHANGDRKVDESVPLPVYTPAGSSSSLTLEAEQAARDPKNASFDDADLADLDAATPVPSS
ncbi:hypothetical protein DENSPDRAFT_598193 [Dentipellis sp. KUC8613]|nr:hypothetical protein DENSPDRAFT_598193 [Dentipellis sp. KUC8613]